MSPEPLQILAASDALTLCTAVTPEQRATLLDFMRARFRKHFDADVDDDSPLLVGTYDRQGTLLGAFGLRDRSSGFFCEHYLSEPLEQALERSFGRTILRPEIVELTHLCAVRPGCLSQLLAILPGALLDLGYRYLTCTATACLARYFERRGLPAVALAEATANALPDAQRQRWGSYYAAGPRVLAGEIGQALTLPTAPLRARSA